ncbi:MAG: SDR family oxidoreductase [Myxococcales bacterium]|nr:SDR family oxidoreductase [Myxococcales bacterium]
MQVAGKRALVTGGGTGVGFGCAQRLLEQGARVLIVGRRDDVLGKAVERLKTIVPGAEASLQVCDITVEDEVISAIHTAAGDGGLDILVANAGSGYPGPILEAPVDAWTFCCELNIVGTATCIKHAALSMKDHGGGSIITISSVGGSKVEKWMAPYSTSKAGLEMLTRCAAVELAPFQIRVNSIAPGYIKTEALADNFSEEFLAGLVERTPLGRAGDPQEVGDAVVYLSSDMGKWVTGQVFSVCGGMSIPQGDDFEELNRMMYGDEVMDACMGRDA